MGWDGKYFRDVDFAPESVNDAGMYNGSNIKVLQHYEYRSYVCLGDSAYELSKNLITPFSENAPTNHEESLIVIMQLPELG